MDLVAVVCMMVMVILQAFSSPLKMFQTFITFINYLNCWITTDVSGKVYGWDLSNNSIKY